LQGNARTQGGRYETSQLHDFFSGLPEKCHSSDELGQEKHVDKPVLDSEK